MANEIEIRFEINRRQLVEFTGSSTVQEGMGKVAQYVETEAKRHAPVRTGNLRRSIYHEVTKDGLTWVARVGTNVKYGIFQEVGTRFHPPHPYLRPALSSLRKQLRFGRL